MGTPSRYVRVFAPATVANVGCGFDALGFAIHGPGDELELRLTEDPGARITAIDGDEGRLPLQADRNTASVAAQALLEASGGSEGVDIVIHKRMPLGSGLGSSSASSAAAVFGLNELLGTPYPPEELLPFAMAGEKVASGTAHADNVAPALLGGFVLIRSHTPLDVIRLPHPPGLYCTILHPHIEVRTEDARRVLRRKIPLEDAVVQWSNLGGLIAGLFREDFDLIGRSLNDIIFEPIRSILIPGFQQFKAAALDAGALGCSISGSGPSLFALSGSEEVAKTVGNAMKEVARKMELGCDLYVSTVNDGGPTVLEKA